jgi:hypothetical protein
MKLHKISQAVLALFALVFLASCSVDDPNFDSDSSFISVKVFGTPSSNDQVFVELSEILVKVLEDESDPKCWIRLPVSNPGVYDLNELVTGNEVLLLDQIKLQSGQVHALKLVIGENNYMIKDDQRYDLFTNIVQQEGLNLKVNAFFKENEEYTYLLNFDVENSIIETYIEDHYVLRPQITISLE